MSSGSTEDVIEKLPSLAAITVPRTLFPFRSSTLLPASADPSIVGVLILVKAISVVINGAAEVEALQVDRVIADTRG